MTKRELRQIQAVALVVISLLYLGFRSLPFNKGGTTSEAKPPPDGVYHVERVVDGDTLKLSGGDRVRLIGVDTPEVHYSDKLVRDARRSGKDVAEIQSMGKAASDFTKAIAAGKKVSLEFDVKKRDRHGRLLAYVYLEDGTFLNAKILEEGYGQVMTVPPNVKYSEVFLKLQQGARENRKGLWGAKNGLK